MRLSEKKKTELYSAIHESIMDLRIVFELTGSLLPQKEVDNYLFLLVGHIWQKVRKSLNIKA